MSLALDDPFSSVDDIFNGSNQLGLDTTGQGFIPELEMEQAPSPVGVLPPDVPQQPAPVEDEEMEDLFGDEEPKAEEES